MTHQGKPPNENLQILQTFLDNNPSIKYIQYQNLDYNAIVQAKFLTTTFALSLASSNKPLSVPSICSAAVLIDRTFLTENWRNGEDELWPDYSTLRVLHYLPGHASLTCNVHETNIHDGNKGYHFDPRHRLIEIVSEVKTEQNLEFLVGNEIEFFICEPPTEDSVPTKAVHTTHYSLSITGLRNRYLPILEEIVDSIVKAGIPVREFHAEGTPGFFEISTDPLPPVQSVDALLYTREAIKSICVKHGLYATMHPKPFEKHSICGAHVHFSLDRTEKEIEDSFFAGVLRSWAALAAVYMANYDSYERVKEGEWVAWGWGNRSVVIRKIKTAHWEFRRPDATANPYLVLLGLITAGLSGLRERLELDVGEVDWSLGVEEMGAEDAKKLRLRDLMPTTLKEAVGRFACDPVLREGLGGDLVDRYASMKGKEASNFSKMTWVERRNIGVRYF